MKEGKTLASRQIHDGKVVRLSVDRVELPNGRVTELEVIRHQGAAAVVPLTDDGEVLLVQYRGVRHGPPQVMQRIAAGELVPPDAYTLRTALVFETASRKYDWINRVVAVGVGRREPGAAIYDVFEVL